MRIAKVTREIQGKLKPMRKPPEGTKVLHPNHCKVSPCRDEQHLWKKAKKSI